MINLNLSGMPNHHDFILHSVHFLPMKRNNKFYHISTVTGYHKYIDKPSTLNILNYDVGRVEKYFQMAQFL